METKRVVTLILFIFFLIGGFVLYFFIYSKQPPISGQTINGRDEHGCLLGFQWNATALSCIKIDTKGNVTYQVLDFQSCYDAGYAIDENSSTGSLQCHALNGTIFLKNPEMNKTNASSGINFPPNIILYGNFTIATNSNNSNVSNPYQNITINSTNISNSS